MDLEAVIRPVRRYPKNSVTCHLDFLLEWKEEPEKAGVLVLEPEFQRGHVWTLAQQRAHVENMLRGLPVNRLIVMNDLFDTPLEGADDRLQGMIVCVDGLQRLTALIRFAEGRYPVFGGRLYYKDIDTCPDRGFRKRLLDNTRLDIDSLRIGDYAELLQYYIDHNSGGTVHSEWELARVSAMLEKERQFTTWEHPAHEGMR